MSAFSVQQSFIRASGAVLQRTAASSPERSVRGKCDSGGFADLAKHYGRYGYRKLTELICIEGWNANHKKVERLLREEGLQLPQRPENARGLGLERPSFEHYRDNLGILEPFDGSQASKAVKLKL